MKRTLLFLLFSAIGYFLNAQSISDCAGAIVLCDELYSEDEAPLNTGNVYEFTGTCNQNLEQSSVWYTFTVQQPGNLGFVLTPNDLTDDYDWGLFDITNGGCTGIGNGNSPTVSCNSWGVFGTNGPTGISTALGGISNNGGPGNFNGPPFNASLPVSPGQSYALVVMNWSNSPFGYSIDFSESTAALFDAIPPAPVSISADCSNSIITLQMSEGILTSSIQAADFLLVNSEGAQTFSSAVGQNANVALNSVLVLTLSQPISDQGTYSLIFTGLSNFIVDGCDNASEGVIDIELFAPITFEAETTSACNGLGGSMEFSNFAGGAEPYTVSVNGFELTELLLEDVPAAMYPVTITDANNCFVNTSITVPNQIVTVSIGLQDSLSCNQSSVVIQNVLMNADLPVSYLWSIISVNGNIEGSQSILNPIIIDPGVYELLVTDPISGCNASAFAEILFAQNLEFDDGELLFNVATVAACNGVGGEMAFSNLNGGQGPYTFTLNGIDFNNLVIQDLPADNYDVTISDVNNCFVTTLVVVPDQILNVTIGAQDLLSCTIDEITIDNVTVVPNQTVNYLWSVISQTGEIQGSNLIINPIVIEPGTFELNIIDPATGCNANDVIQVQSDPNLEFEDDDLLFDIGTVIACNGAGGAMEFSNITGGNAPYTVTVNGFELPGFTLGNLPPNVYPIVIADANNCFINTELIISNHNISVSIGLQDTLSCIENFIAIQNVIVVPEQSVTYNWTVSFETGSFVGPTNVENPQVTTEGLFNLEVTHPISGCTASATTEVVAEEAYTFDEDDLEFPNIVSPNGDGKNEIWIPYLKSDPEFNITQLMQEFELKVFNRWGNKLYDSDANKKFWKPGDLDGGVYYYTLRFKITCGDGLERNIEGSIQVVK